MNFGVMLDDWEVEEEPVEDDDLDVGTCWCGAYGPAGAVHVAKPSAEEPPEECGRYL